MRRNKDRPVARSVDPGVLGASELEDKLVNAMNRGMAKWTQELRSMSGDGTPPNNGGKARPNQPKPEAEAKLNIGGDTPVKKEVNREVATPPKTAWTPKVPNTTRYFECYKCCLLYTSDAADE